MGMKKSIHHTDTSIIFRSIYKTIVGIIEKRLSINSFPNNKKGISPKYNFREYKNNYILHRWAIKQRSNFFCASEFPEYFFSRYMISFIITISFSDKNKILICHFLSGSMKIFFLRYFTNVLSQILYFFERFVIQEIFISFSLFFATRSMSIFPTFARVLICQLFIRFGCGVRLSIIFWRNYEIKEKRKNPSFFLVLFMRKKFLNRIYYQSGNSNE